jgi:hypothetical protein
MNKVLVIGDLHLKHTSPYFEAQQQFLNWLDENYRGNTFIFVGDELDSSAPDWEVFSMFANFLEKQTQVYLLGGNHTHSRRKGSVLEGINHLPNVKVILEKEEITINNYKCLFLPFKYSLSMKEEYESLKGSYDFIFTHITPPESAFGNEGINLSVQGTTIHGHIHLAKNFIHNENQHYIIGVPIATRHGEIDNPIFEIVEGKIVEITHPSYFEYETVEFGQLPKNKNNVLNIINAPDSNSVNDFYKDYFVRDIELKRTENALQENITFNAATIKIKFYTFCLENGVSKEILDCGLRYLGES